MYVLKSILSSYSSHSYYLFNSYRSYIVVVKMTSKMVCTLKWVLCVKIAWKRAKSMGI